MSNTCAINQQMFCTHFVMVIASGRQVIPLPESTTRDCAIMTTKFCCCLLAPYIAIFCLCNMNLQSWDEWQFLHNLILYLWSGINGSKPKQLMACARKRSVWHMIHNCYNFVINLEMFVTWKYVFFNVPWLSHHLCMTMSTAYSQLVCISSRFGLVSTISRPLSSSSF